MAYFPMMTDLSDKTCLLVGGGPVAAHKLRILAGFGASFRIVATLISEELLGCVKEIFDEETDSNGQPEINILERPFQDMDLEGADLVIVAVRENPSLGNHISALCKERKIPINVVDDPVASTFIFPAMLRRGDLLIAVSTGGKSPTAAGIIKERITESVPEMYGQLIDSMGEIRGYVIEHVEEHRRKEVFRHIFEYMEEHDGELSEKELEQICQSKKLPGL